MNNTDSTKTRWRLDDVMDNSLHSTSSEAVMPAASAARSSKPVAVARPILRTEQATHPAANSIIKNDDHAVQPPQTSSERSVCSDLLRHVTESTNHAHHERAKQSRDACAAQNAATCPHASPIPSTGDIFRQLTACSFYFGRLSVSEASRRLAPCDIGTFLLRDSSDRRYLFALSVRTHRGPTSVRLAREDSGRFRLDCDPYQRSSMPTFPSVVDLVRYYFRPAIDRHFVLMDSSVNTIPVRLTATLTASGRPSTLAHLARLTVHHTRLRRLEQADDRLECVDCFADSLPSYVDEKAKTFLRSYPFDL